MSPARRRTPASLRRPTRFDGDQGAAIVEFVLVSVIVVAFIWALMQLAFALYVRNTLTAAAAEGARFAAAADRDPVDAVPFTRALIDQSLPSGYATDVAAGTETVDGVPTIYVEVQASLPLFGWFGSAGSLAVRGHAMDEDSDP